MRLTNTRHELFAQAIASGNSGSKAYVQAGYDAKGNAAEVNASRLLRNAQVEARIAQLRGEAAKAAQVDRTWLLERLAKNILIATGEQKIKVSVIRTVGHGKNRRTVVVEEEVTDRDANAANKGIELMGRAIDKTLFSDKVDEVPPLTERPIEKGNVACPDFNGMLRGSGPYEKV